MSFTVIGLTWIYICAGDALFLFNAFINWIGTHFSFQNQPYSCIWGPTTELHSFLKKKYFPSFPVATHLGPTKLPNVTHFLSFLQPKCLHLGYLMGLARHIYPHLLFHQDAREKMEFSIREDIKKEPFLSTISGKFKLNDPNLLKSRVGSQVWYNCTK